MNFFSISRSFCDSGLDFDFEAAESSRVGDAPRCTLCGRFCGMLRLVPPIHGTLCVEASTFDLAVVSGGEILLSERCLGIFHANGIMGLVEPTLIEVLEIEGPLDAGSVGKYYLADAVRWGADLDRAKSGIRTTENATCPNCGYAGLIDSYDRICIVESSWTGQDLFRVKGLPGAILVTDRLRQFLMKHHLTVCSIIPAEEDRMPMLRRT